MILLPETTFITMPFPISIILPEGKCEHMQNSLWENKRLVSGLIFGFILGNSF